MATLSQLLSSVATIFVVVGAGHLVGPDGLPTLLAEAGYRVERIIRVDELF